MPISRKPIPTTFQTDRAEPIAVYNPFTKEWTVDHRPATRAEAILAVIDRRQHKPSFAKAA